VLAELLRMGSEVGAVRARFAVGGHPGLLSGTVRSG
jgi:hypothetical protein